MTPSVSTRVGTTFANNRRFLPLLVTILLLMVAYSYGAASYQGMRDPQIFFNLFRNSPYLLISALGMTFVILSGGIDLSVSGVVALTTVASAALLRESFNAWAVMALMLGMGMALGAVMGFFITNLKVQPFIATLAGMWFARGMCFFISDDAIEINNRIYTILARTKILIPGLADPVTKTGDYISILVVLELVVFAAAIYIAHFTRFGRTVYAIGGNEQSARLMGLPVNATKMKVYMLNGFCSALAGITLSMTVMSGHGLYAPGFEMTVISSVVIGGTMLTGGEGYVFGTLFGVLITMVIQTLIQFDGKLSSWWTSIMVGALTLIFIGVQSQLSASRTRQAMGSRVLQGGLLAGLKGLHLRGRRALALGVAAIVLPLIVLGITLSRNAANSENTSAQAAAANCEWQPFRRNEADALLQSGAVITYERNGGSECIAELYAIYPDGRITADNGVRVIEAQVSAEDITRLVEAIASEGWFSDGMYDTWHTPCRQCYGYYVSITHDDQQKTVKAVDGGTDAPSEYWQVVSLINAIIPKFE